MMLTRTALFYAAPPVILGTLFTVYRVWFSGDAAKPAEPPPSEITQPLGPVDPFGGGDTAVGGGTVVPPTPPAVTSAVPSPPPAAPPTPVTDLDSAARFVQKLAAELYAAFPEVAEWARIPDVISQVAQAVDCISEGGSPRRPLSFLAPKQPFQAKQVADGWVIDPASYGRYDRAVGAFCAGDAALVGAAYLRLEPALDLAYRKLGYGSGRFREKLALAAGELLAVPVPAGSVYVVPGGPTYTFADPALQAQNDARKHLLRSGPDNVRRVQARIRALAAALKLEIVSQ